MGGSAISKKMIISLIIAIAVWPRIAITQDKIINAPIVSDVEVDTSKVLRIVSKDEIQRISDNGTLRMQRIEAEIKILKSHIVFLESEIQRLEKEIEGG